LPLQLSAFFLRTFFWPYPILHPLSEAARVAID
jgi:hypothetical protein